MKVWKWGYDCENYDSFTFPNTLEILNKYINPHFKGSIIGEKWGHVPFKTIRYGKIPSDCTGYANNIPILNERAVKLLSPFLDSNVELLPLLHPTQKFFAVNVIRLIDGLDYNQSEIDYMEEHPGFIDNINRFVFRLESIQDYPIFKIPELKRLQVFVTDVFKEAVETNGLNGFTFELLWDSEDDGGYVEPRQERHYQEALATIERNKAEEFSFDEAISKVEAGESCASGKWRLQQALDATMRLGNLQADGSYSWIQPIYYPPILLDLRWQLVKKLPLE